MSRRIYFYIPLSFILFSLKAKCQNYTYYYRQTQYAEEALLNGEFETSLKYYDAAFDKYDFRFARDCYIAAQVAAYLNKSDATLKYLRYCIRTGVRYECLSRTRHIRDFLKTDAGGILLEEKDSLFKIYLHRIDINLNREFTERYDEEQHIKIEHSRRYYNVVEENLHRIIELTEQGRFPGEEMIGILNTIVKSKTPNLFGDCDHSFYSNLAIPTLQHYSYSYDLMKSKLMKAMYRGQIHPRTVILIFQFSQSRWCGYPKQPPRNIELLIEHSADSSLVFNYGWEKKNADSTIANKNRNDWFYPRLGTKYTDSELLKEFGIATNIGD